MFSAKMTYVVLAPYWHVPPVIAAVDKLPVLRKNPGYLAAQHMTLFSTRRQSARGSGHRGLVRHDGRRSSTVCTASVRTRVR